MLLKKVEEMLSVKTVEERKVVQKAWDKFNILVGAPQDKPNVSKVKDKKKKRAKLAKKSRKQNRKG